MIYPSDTSKSHLAMVLAEYDRLEEDPHEATANTCETMGRLLLAMYNEHAHPARMFHLISQVAQAEDPDVLLLLPLAWAAAEGKLSLKPVEGVN